ncbi:MAG: hypothetical protein Q4A74_06145 [Cardiobacteriaceae bacterium]|nr:hypothetical protein [Cardiobacteriaceae bacterium]
MFADKNDSIAVLQLLQIIVPMPDRVTETSVQEVIQEADEHDLPLMWAVYRLLKDEAVYAVEWKDIFELVQQLRTVAAHWQADILFGVRDSDEEMEASIYDFPSTVLLRQAAYELQTYGLTLWRWQADNPDLCIGFISRTEDEDLLLRCAMKINARFIAVTDDEALSEDEDFL